MRTNSTNTLIDINGQIFDGQNKQKFGFGVEILSNIIALYISHETQIWQVGTLKFPTLSLKFRKFCPTIYSVRQKFCLSKFCPTITTISLVDIIRNPIGPLFLTTINLDHASPG